VSGWRRIWAAITLFVVVFAAGCGGNDADVGATPPGDGLVVVATTTQIEDMARQIAGERATVTGLMPANADPHDFEPTPGNIEKVADADLILEHGLHLDEWAEDLVEQSGTQATIAVVTERIVPIEGEAGEEHDEAEGAPEAEGDHGGDDPHVWFDVANARVMVENIRSALIEADLDGRGDYEAGATAYLAQLDELDAWIREQVATVPAANRKLVTDHDAFGYYVRAYGFTFVGAVIPGLDTQSQPSAQETAELIDHIRAERVKAIFTTASLSPDLARQIADEAGVAVVDDLYGDALGPEGSGAETYVGMMRWNTTRIVEALR
jgi:ABC-type Zn uptake system ZnuABC Zn-binding protein ZnuA